MQTSARCIRKRPNHILWDIKWIACLFIEWMWFKKRWENRHTHTIVLKMNKCGHLFSIIVLRRRGLVDRKRTNVSDSSKKGSVWCSTYAHAHITSHQCRMRQLLESDGISTCYLLSIVGNAIIKRKWRCDGQTVSMTTAYNSQMRTIRNVQKNRMVLCSI